MLENNEYGRVLGYCRAGGAPTVIVPEGHAYLTAIHEQVHFDDFTNTLWGAILRCESDIERDQAHRGLVTWQKKYNQRRLIRSAWKVLEGSAVCTEVLSLHHFSRTDFLDEFYKYLPTKYERASRDLVSVILDGFVKNTGLVISDPMQYLLVHQLKSAIVELSLDLRILGEGGIDGSYEKARRLALKSRPTKNLKRVLQALPHTDLSVVPDLAASFAMSHENEDIVSHREMALLSRTWTCAIKKLIAEVLLDSQDIDLSDDRRIEIIGRFYEEICEEFRNMSVPAVIRIAPETRVTDVTAGVSVDVDIQGQLVSEQEFLGLFDTDKDILEYISEEEKDKFCCRMVWLTIDNEIFGGSREGGEPAQQESRRSLACELTFLRTEEPGSVAGMLPLIRYVELSRSQLSQIAMNRPRPSDQLAWLGYGIVDEEGNIRNSDYWFGRPDPVYLWCPVYSDEVMIGIRGKFGARASFTVGPSPGPLGFTLFCVAIDHVTLFWLDVNQRPLEEVQRAGFLMIGPEMKIPYFEISDSHLFDAAYVAAIHLMSNAFKDTSLYSPHA